MAMGLQLLILAFGGALFVLIFRGTQTEFMQVWFELLSAGKVTIEDYDTVWMQFIMPRIGLFLLIVVPFQIAYSLDVRPRRRRGKLFGFSI